MTNHYHLRRKRLDGILRCTDEKCGHRRGETLRVFKRKEARDSGSTEQATTDHHISKGFDKGMTYAPANFRVLCHKCHTERTTQWNVRQSQGAPSVLPCMDQERIRILRVTSRAKKFTVTMRLQAAKADVEDRMKQPRASDSAVNYDRWESFGASKGICPIYGCSNVVTFSEIGWCEQCHMQHCFWCLGRCSRIGCERLVCVDCKSTHHKHCQGRPTRRRSVKCVAE